MTGFELWLIWPGSGLSLYESKALAAGTIRMIDVDDQWSVVEGTILRKVEEALDVICTLGPGYHGSFTIVLVVRGLHLYNSIHSSVSASSC